MAVYTEVGDTELDAFLAEYDIGEAEALKGVAEGVENSNYLLTTTKGQYFLTLYEKRVDPRDLPFFLGLLDHRADSGRGRRHPSGGTCRRLLSSPSRTRSRTRWGKFLTVAHRPVPSGVRQK